MQSLAPLSLKALFLSTLLACAAGCAGAADGDASQDDGEDAVSAEEALKAGITPGSFKLYDQPGHQPSPGCDIHTALELKRSSATLEERVGGMCQVAVQPNTRTFRLKSHAGGPCGIMSYTGAKTIKGVKHTIEIADYRHTTCALAMPYFGEIVVTETVGSAAPQMLYSEH